MLDISFGLTTESNAVIAAVDAVLKAGYRTSDIANSSTQAANIVGTEQMGQLVLAYLK
jgi:3-isopropylmalate dehydrogenase